ncbi:DMT family transporter [Phytohabitans rumicis]|uniref:Membrane protein n=1 Tax=Phytohabitans rumicis TaxID=1076125 RepID=A0A6V8L2G4_9ACTN|nr:DMT family transporter [Phytohabitans rumicis]GFJ88819.1 membrane protein [Phytohabitans rumicis]
MPARGFLFISIAATAWGSGAGAATLLYRTSGLGPIAVSWWRFVIGVTILAAVLAVRRRRRFAVRPNLTLIATGVGLAVYQCAFYAAIAYVGLAVGTVVTLGAGPVLIAFGARFVLGERLGRAGTTAVGLAIAGLVLLTGGSGAAGPRPALGIGLALLSAAGYAAVTLLTRATGTSGDPYDTALVGFVIGGMCLLPLALVEGLMPAGQGLAGTVGWLLYLGAVPTALAYGLFFAGLGLVRATTASVVALLEPVAATAIAVGLFGERLSTAALVGTLVLLGAVAALATTEHR